MARVPLSSPVASPPPVLYDPATGTCSPLATNVPVPVVPISQLNKPNGKPRLTDEELHRRFCDMLDQVYEYARTKPSPIRAVVLDYRDYLRRLSLQELDE